MLLERYDEARLLADAKGWTIEGVAAEIAEQKAKGEKPEHAHLAPELDINALTELVALSKGAHEGVSNVWTCVRPYKSQLTASDIREVIAIIDRYFQRWYNVPAGAVSEAETIAAEKAAIQEVERLLAAMKGR